MARLAALTTSRGNVLVRRYFQHPDLPLEGRKQHEAFAIAAALRGIRYYDQIMAIAPRRPEAGLGLLRSLVDLVNLLKWIEPSPRLRFALNMASDDMDRVRVLTKYNAVRAGRGHAPVSLLTAQEIRRISRRAHLLRKVAVARGGERVSPKERDPLMPSIADRTDLGGDALELQRCSKC